MGLVGAILICFTKPIHADVVWSGDLAPPDPTTWTSGTNARIGDAGSGTLDITLDSDVLDFSCDIGHASGSTGIVTVDGAGSTWTNSSNLFVGRSGNGTLNITNGGDVSNSDGYIGRYSDSTGEVIVDGIGSTWTNSGNLYISTGKMDEAIGAYKKAVEIKPDYADAYNNLGNTYKDKGKYEKAIALYKKAISLNPSSSDMYYNLADAHLKLLELGREKDLK